MHLVCIRFQYFIFRTNIHTLIDYFNTLAEKKEPQSNDYYQ